MYGPDELRTEWKIIDLDFVDRACRRRDRPALSLMLSEPITAFPGQITNGIHRLTAMRGQGIRWTVGYDLVADEGGGTWMRSIDEEPF